jgi:ABC-type molybdate transport system substrate-binding protein
MPTTPHKSELKRKSHGKIHWLAILSTIAISIGPAPSSLAKESKPLLVFCAAGVKPPVEAAARAYEKEYGIPVHLQYGGSGTLLSNLRIAKSGDLFIAGDDSYIRAGREHGVIREAIPLARMRPVIAVKKGNPKKIRTLADLLRPDVSVALANPDAASIGRTTKIGLEKEGSWAAMKEHAKVFKPTVSDIANDVKLGTVDAGIIWDATAAQYPELEAISAQAFDSARETITAGILSSSESPAAAFRFARYLGAHDKGLKEFSKNHYEVVDGDTWAESPDLKLFSGAMLRPGVSETLKEFQEREGVTITTVYNGCGILTAQMRAGQRPDAYFSCDTTFMNSVADLFIDPENIVDNHLMILVAKGNPKGIKEPKDLLQSGLRVGLPDHEKSAMGNVAWKMLKDMGIYEALQANMKVESPTGDLLVNQLRTGSLDAIIACRSNLYSVQEHLEGIPIQHPLANMTQPYAVGKESQNKNLAARLHEAILAKESRQRFEAAGFRWVAEKP